MTVTRLQLQGIRNLEPLKLIPHPQLNLIVGSNASGKSSLLEAIHFLGLGRSFRTGLSAKVLQRGASEFIIFAEINSHPVGLRWQRSSGIEAKIKGKPIGSLSELPVQLPLQLITPEAGILVSGGPKERRSFIDWGAFHVEPQFHSLWKRYRRLLKQRNAAIKMKYSRAQVVIWDAEYVDCAERISLFRKEYVKSLLPELIKNTQLFIPELKFDIEFYRGWDSDSSLLELLESNYERDLHLGFTQLGPHKAELKIKTEGVLAAQHLSRGQQKLLVCALRLAQGTHLQRHKNGNVCTFLIDDFSSELDSVRQALLAEMLLESKSQVFVTGISNDDLKLFQQDEYKLFHVEQGKITEAERAYD